MTTDLVRWLEDRHFITDEGISSAIQDYNAEQLLSLRHELKGLLKAQPFPENGLGVFDFFASSSFRGDRCCEMPNCRMKKADQLFEFSALYADHLHLPLRLGGRDKVNMARAMEGSIRQLAHLRPLIDAQLVIPHIGDVNLCASCRKGLYPLQSDLEMASLQIGMKYIDLIRVEACIRERTGQRQLGVAFFGPEEILGTRGRTRYLSAIPEWATGLGSRWEELSKSCVEENNILAIMMSSSENDLFIQHILGGLQNTTYLTDTHVEAEFFQAAVSREEKEVWRAETLAHLTHTLPVFQELPLEDLVRLRMDEHDAFLNYRNAIRRAVMSDVGAETPQKAAARIWQDEIRPEVEALESKAAVIRSVSRRAYATRFLAASATISMGLFGSHLPPGFAHALETVCACTLLKDFLPPLSKGGTESIRTDGLFFLFKARDTARSRR